MLMWFARQSMMYLRAPGLCTHEASYSMAHSWTIITQNRVQSNTFLLYLLRNIQEDRCVLW